MPNWTAGYVAEIDYTYGFYRELTPSVLAFCASMANLATPVSLSSFRYCELGCGQGFSANVIAAANPNAEVYATDFNPSQIAGARQLADEAGWAMSISTSRLSPISRRSPRFPRASTSSRCMAFTAGSAPRTGGILSSSFAAS